MMKRTTDDRQLDIPADLLAALAGDEAVQTAFDKLPYSHKKEYVEWIETAKKPETRQRRIQSALEMIVKRNG